MNESVFMSSELEGHVDLTEKDKVGGPVELEHRLFATLKKDSKTSKPVRAGRYVECTENSRLVRKLELFLTDEEFRSVAESRPDGFTLLLGDAELFRFVKMSDAHLSIEAVGTPETYSHVWLSF